MNKTFELRLLNDGWNRFGIATLHRPDGTRIERALEDHGAAVCVLPYDPQRRMALLVRQVRVGPAFWGGTGEIDEAPAGGLDGGAPEDMARREALEEAGVRIGALEPVVCAFSMPSISSERLHLFLAPYAASDCIATGGGVAHEGEQMSVLEVPLATLGARAGSGQISDMKTLVLVQALQLRRPDLFIQAASGPRKAMTESVGKS